MARVPLPFSGSLRQPIPTILVPKSPLLRRPMVIEPFQPPSPGSARGRGGLVILGGGSQVDDDRVSLKDRTWIVRFQEARDGLVLAPPAWDARTPTSQQLSESFRTVGEFIAFSSAAFMEIGDGLQRAGIRITNYLVEQRQTNPRPCVTQFAKHLSDGRHGRQLHGLTGGAGLVLVRSYAAGDRTVAEFRPAQGVILLNMTFAMPLGDIVEDRRLDTLTSLAHELFHGVMNGHRTTTVGLGVVEDQGLYPWEYQPVRFWEEGIGTALGLYVRECYQAYQARNTAAPNTGGAYGAAYWDLAQGQVGLDRSRFPPDYPEIARLIEQNVLNSSPPVGTKNWQYPLWDDTQGVIPEPPDPGVPANPLRDHTSISIYQSWRFFATLLEGDMRWVGLFMTRLGELLGPEHNNRTAASLNEVYFNALRDAMEDAIPGDARQARISVRFANVIRSAGRWTAPAQWRVAQLVHDAATWTATLPGALPNGAIALTMPLQIPPAGVVIGMAPNAQPPLRVPGAVGLKPMSALSLRLIFREAGRYSITLPANLRAAATWKFQLRISGQTDDDRWIGLPLNEAKAPVTIEFDTRVEADSRQGQYQCADIDLLFVETQITPATMSSVQEWSFTVHATQ